jgi:hypothetical protein
MSVKKETAGRSSVQSEVEVPGRTQSAVARRSAEADSRTLIDKFASAHLRLVGAMRQLLRTRQPTAHEVVLGRTQESETLRWHCSAPILASSCCTPARRSSNGVESPRLSN